MFLSLASAANQVCGGIDCESVNYSVIMSDISKGMRADCTCVTARHRSERKKAGGAGTSGKEWSPWNLPNERGE